MERKKLFISDWNDTKKLINIYGIASAMSFLHSHNILHRDLKPQNIFLDDFLYPKIGDFGLSTKFHSVDSLSYQSISGLKGTPVYSAPEVLQDNCYSKSSDVYAFSFIVFEIITNEIPFQFLNNMNQIYSEIVIKGNRPEFNKNIPSCYRSLIEKTWSQNPNERLSFNEIEKLLKTDLSFISKGVNKSEYFKYIQMIDEFEASYNSTEKILQLDDLIKAKSRIIENDNSNNSTKRILHHDDSIESENQIIENDNSTEKILHHDDSIESENQIIENDNSNSIEKLIQKYIQKANQQSIKLYNLQSNQFDLNNEKFLAKKNSIENDSECTFVHMNNLINKGELMIPLEYAMNLYKLKHFKPAFYYFSRISQFNHPIAKYFLGVMTFRGEGIRKNKDEAYKILKNLSDNGINQASEFLEDNPILPI